MDNVSSIEFKYEIIRQPKKQSKNIFEYAVNLSIIQDNKLFLQFEDICIIDFIHELSLYSENNDFITSDTPVVSIHGTKAQYLGFKSLICVPLTTNCCIAFLENKKYNGQIISLTPKQVDDVNLAQASKDYGLLISKKEKWIDRYFLNKKALGS